MWKKKKKVKFEKGDVVVMPHTALMPGRVVGVSDLTLVVKPSGGQPIVIRKEFCKHATKLDIDQFIIKCSWKLVEIEASIEALENLREEVAEIKNGNA